MKTKRNLNARRTIKMQRSFRDSNGPEFDNRLIQLVRGNPAIYDVKHPHYRRNQVRIAIWERIAYELAAPSKFVQTKWKNIRYNYLQELKSLETGIINANVRKRRFTEDLSFLQNTAQTYNMRKNEFKNNHSSAGSDNDSNSYLYPDGLNGTNAYEVIEIEHSDDGSCNDDDEFFDVLNGIPSKTNDKRSPKSSPTQQLETAPVEAETSKTDPESQMQLEQISSVSPTALQHSNRSSPLLTPLVVMENGDKEKSETKVQPAQAASNDIELTNDEPFESSMTQPRPRTALQKHSNNVSPSSLKHTTQAIPPEDIMKNAARRKAMQAPFPVLTPINDPIELYCLSLVDSLRNMPRTERERVKYEFAKILKDAKYIEES